MSAALVPWLAGWAAGSAPAQDLGVACHPDLSAGRVAAAPLSVECVPVYPAGADWAAVEWQWGDGPPTTDLVGTHTWSAPGVYRASLTVRGLTTGGPPADAVAAVPPVTVCGPAAPRFTVERVEGLTYRMVELGSADPTCRTAVAWTARTGGADGPVVLGPDPGPAPTFTLPSADAHTFVLEVTGVAGTERAALTVDPPEPVVHRNVARQPHLHPHEHVTRGCAAAPAPAGSLAASFGWVALVVVALRRR